jgi:hypothetical protein
LLKNHHGVLKGGGLGPPPWRPRRLIDPGEVMNVRARAISREPVQRHAGRTTARMCRLSLLGMVASTVIIGCGATTAPDVARVQGSSISQAELDHWTAIKRRELQGSPTAAAASPAELKSKALAFLITAEWLEKEAAAQGVSVSPSEVDTTYQQLLNGPTGSSFAASLKRRGLSGADELRVLRLGALAQKLRTKIAVSRHSGSAAQTRRQVAAFLVAYQQRWKQRTTCAPGYVIAECRTGPALPASPSGQ